MQTLKQIVSDLSSDLRGINLDDRYSFRHLANKFRDKISYFLRLESRSREFLKAMGAWKPINCVELEDYPITTCGDLPGCNTLKRSKIQLPEAYETNYGTIIKILTIDGLQEFPIISSSFNYKDYMNRVYGVKRPPVWIENRYLFLANSDIESVKILLMPKDPIEIDKLNCTASPCASPLDVEINYAPYLITLAKQEVLKELGVFKTLPEDEKGDDNTNRKT